MTFDRGERRWEGGKVMGGTGDSAPSVHDMRQPLNIVQLACANLRARFAHDLDGAQAAYLEAKISRIEEQVARLDAMLGARFGAAPPVGKALHLAGEDEQCTG